MWPFSTRRDSDESKFLTQRLTSSFTDELPPYTPPNIDDAQEFSSMQMPRRIKDSSQGTGYRLARVGELVDENGNPAEAYPGIFTPDDALNEFGLGTALYFKTLKVMFLCLFLCCFVSLVAIYQNRKFNPDQADIDEDKILYSSSNDPVPTPVELVGSVYGAERNDLKISHQAASDIFVCCVIVLLALCSGYIQGKVEEWIDVSQQTTSDYSVEITNPPNDVRDTKEYFEYFSRFGEVVLVTIVLNNGEFIKALADQKVIEQKIGGLKIGNTDEGQTRTIFNKWGIVPDVYYWEEQLEKIQTKLTGLSNRDYYPWKVFVTFNREAGQRECLDRMSIGLIEATWNQKTNEDAVFKDKSLYVIKAMEPNDVIYENSHYKSTIVWLRLLTSYCVCAGLLAISFSIIQALQNSGNIGVALFISLLNSFLPVTIKMITDAIEIHTNSSKAQRSILFKLVITRCINSAILIYVAVPYNNQFGIDNLHQIQNVLIADAITTPLLRLFNVYDIVMRFVVAPYTAQTQQEYNSYWAGADWTLAERYTDMIKTLFLGLFFAVPLPSGLFITAFAMINTYLVDKYSLLTLWKRGPAVDADLANLSRYFFIVIVWVHFAISKVYFANWPYRGLFDQDSGPKADCTFFICHTNSDMTNDQKEIVDFYSTCSVLVFIAVLVFFTYLGGKNVLKLWIRTDYSSEDTVAVNFRDIRGHSAYIANVSRATLTNPVICSALAVPTSYIDLISNCLPWKNVEDPKDFSVCKLSELPSLKSDTEIEPLFSKTTYFPDKKKREIILSSFNSCLSPTNGASVNIELPCGWVREIVDNKTIFVDYNTYTAPAEKQPPFYEAKSKTVFGTGSIGLEKKKTISGKFFIVDHNSKSTRWAN